MSNDARSEITQTFFTFKIALLGVVVFSAIINLLMLTGAFYMLQIYDRVLTSGSIPTLIVLSMLAIFLLLSMGVLDMIRSRLMVRVAASFDQKLSKRVFGTIVRMPLSSQKQGDGLQPARDLDSVRSFLSSPGPLAFIDMPWVPIYVGIIFAFHPLLGIAALIGALILVLMAFLSEYFTRRPTLTGARYAQLRNTIANAGKRNAEVLTAMGMRERLADRWQSANDDYIKSQVSISDIAGGFGAMSKAFRMILQSAMLGLGAFLVINQQASPGVIIAGAILAGRALAPVDQAIGQWRGFVSARQSWHRLKKLLFALPQDTPPMPLSAPSKDLLVENVVAVPAGTQKLVLQGVGFRLSAGHCLGIIGKSASGKSSLARLLVGAWRPLSGKVCLDNIAIDQWSSEALGKSIGYMPQDVELFEGTIAENIARFTDDAPSDLIVDAAKKAGVHNMITNFPDGYNTNIGDGGQVLSAGQKQRIALARALYGDPFLLVLDEPNSNLDSEGEKALVAAIDGVRSRNGIVVVIAHRMAVLNNVDFLMVLKDGKIIEEGPRKSLMMRMAKKATQSANNGAVGSDFGGIL